MRADWPNPLITRYFQQVLNERSAVNNRTVRKIRVWATSQRWLTVHFALNGNRTVVTGAAFT